MLGTIKKVNPQRGRSNIIDIHKNNVQCMILGYKPIIANEMLSASDIKTLRKYNCMKTTDETLFIKPKYSKYAILYDKLDLFIPKNLNESIYYIKGFLLGYRQIEIRWFYINRFIKNNSKMSTKEAYQKYKIIKKDGDELIQQIFNTPKFNKVYREEKEKIKLL